MYVVTFACATKAALQSNFAIPCPFLPWRSIESKPLNIAAACVKTAFAGRCKPSIFIERFSEYWLITGVTGKQLKHIVRGIEGSRNAQ
jgi:hypothetical protein